MANADNASGLSPVCYLNGAPYNGQANEYDVLVGDGTAIMIGDPVVYDTGDSLSGRPVVKLGAAAGVFGGICVGVIPTDRDSTIYRVASTARTILVADDPQILFEVQEDSGGGDIALASIGLNITLITAAGSTFTGMSGWELDSSSVATTNSLDCQLLRGVDRADNTLVSDNARWLVRLNNHQFVDGTTGVA
jgi:hypothetical protein